MLKFKLEHSTDNDISSDYEISNRSISFGRSLNCDFIIDDDLIDNKQISIYQTEKKLIIETKSIKYKTLINGKQISGLLVLKEKDVITFGSAKIEILKFSPAQTSKVQDKLRDQFEIIAKNDPNLANLLIAIKNKISTLKSKEDK